MIWHTLHTGYAFATETTSGRFAVIVTLLAAIITILSVSATAVFKAVRYIVSLDERLGANTRALHQHSRRLAHIERLVSATRDLAREAPAEIIRLAKEADDDGNIDD